eukprot:COSAG02_NODE_59893_length_273_cov_0.568966_1_plen_59_part_10
MGFTLKSEKIGLPGPQRMIDRACLVRPRNCPLISNVVTELQGEPEEISAEKTKLAAEQV